MTQESNIADLLAAAVQQHEDGDLVAAETLYRQVLARNPEHPDALHLLGLIAQAARDLTGAAASIRHAIALRPGESVFHYNLANVLRDAGQLNDAIASYRVALTLHNLNGEIDADTLLNLGNALVAHGEPGAAADSYRTLLRNVPHHLEAQVNLGQVLRVLGDMAGARAAFQAVMTLDAGNVASHLGLGVLCQEAGDFDAAW